VAARNRSGPFKSIEDFHHRSGISVSAIRQLAEGDAFGSLGITRRQALWQTMKLRDEELPLFDAQTGKNSSRPCLFSEINRDGSYLLSAGDHALDEPVVVLPSMPLGQEVMTDYSTAGLSLKRHPVSF